jgi:2-oxoglutarate ferredoxin oxidoreductase subunit delta
MEKKTVSKKKIARVLAEKCKGCNLCIRACPAGALKSSKELNKRGFSYVYLEDPEKCTGCGLCALVCPDFGVEIVVRET